MRPTGRIFFILLYKLKLWKFGKPLCINLKIVLIFSKNIRKALSYAPIHTVIHIFTIICGLFVKRFA